MKILGTKAQTLENLERLLKKSKVEKFYFFKVSVWKERKEIIGLLIKNRFEGKIVVRSSSVLEDTEKESKAGYFKSVLDVDPSGSENAIEEVIGSYDDNPENEVLIQQQSDVEFSGVLFTRKHDGTPYYVINYDSFGSTSSVTSGMENKKLDIIRNISTSDLEYPWYNLIESVREIELFLPEKPLDIEFGISSDGSIIIFQVRPLISVKAPTKEQDEEFFNLVNKLVEEFPENGVFSDMSFWNPSEIIGTLPNRLDYSLYQYLIMKKAWIDGITPLGYSKTKGSLMESFGGKPYVNLHKVFHALLPNSLPLELSIKLVDFYFQKLYSHPELHDKVEFEIAPNSYHHCFYKVADELSENGFTIEEINTFTDSLIRLTENILKRQTILLHSIENDIAEMNKKREAAINNMNSFCTNSVITTIKTLLDDCIHYGTVNFAMVARMAFIAKISLDSLIEVNLITEELRDEFMNSFSTVASEFDGSEKYGHLRPGTYDITSLRYDQIEMRLTKPIKRGRIPKLPESLRWEKDFITKMIQRRELVKFEFTKNISDALELIANLGASFGFTREDMAQLDIMTILGSLDRDDIKEYWSHLIKGRREQKNLYRKLSLPPLLFSKNDFKVVPTYVAKPNFITELKTEGEVVFLEKERESVGGKIVLIKNADPGYDWIFTEGMRGLVTCYGGVASHMSIRCAEFGIPAAIGCGTELFENLKKKERISLDCKEETIE
jgi:hypothetical protein